MQNPGIDSAAEPAQEPPAGALACVTCRNRKLKCDRVMPICARCAKANIECIYPESRRKPAFKRRNVRELEERLAQVEGLLKEVGKVQDADPSGSLAEPSELPLDRDFGAASEFDINNQEWFPNATSDFTFAQGPSGPQDSANPFGELIGLGQFETLPPIELIEDLHNIFFLKQQHFSPFVHKATYLKAFYSAPHMRPPMCLQYAIWTMAANGHEKYEAYHDVFYRRCRQYLEADELKGHGEHFLTISHAQAWGLIATDEARGMFFTRASMSCSRVVRLVQMMGLHRLDDPLSEDNPMAPTLAPPQSWVELEERRRLFWGAFCIDSHASITTGWPNLIDQTGITTHLPSSEEAFETGREEKTGQLKDALSGMEYSTFAGAAVVCHIFNQLLKHVHRSMPEDRPEDLEHGPFWKQHRELDNILSMAFMFLPERFRLPKHIRNPVAVHKNLNLHACLICLHVAACDKAETYKLPETVLATSRTRSLTAAQEIVNIVKLTSHINGYRSPLVSLSLYCAASVYIHQAKDDPALLDVANLEFLLQCMLAIGREHLITRAHLQQALLDIERHGLTSLLSSRWHMAMPFGVECGHNIPMLARSSVSKHSKPQPPLPGRLPLGRPEGNPRTYPAWNTPMRSMPWYLGDGSWSNQNRPPEANAASLVEGGATDAPGSKRRRMGHNSGSAEAVQPAPRFMELPHRGSSAASSPHTGSGSGPTPPTTATSVDGLSGACPITGYSPGTTNTARPQGQNITTPSVETTPLERVVGGSSATLTPIPGMDVFSNMDQWDEATEALLAQVTEFSPSSTDPWLLLNSRVPDGDSWNADAADS